MPSYAASKIGIAAITKALANEWARYGIHVNAIAPGWTKTDMTAALRENPVRNEQISQESQQEGGAILKI